MIVLFAYKEDTGKDRMDNPLQKTKSKLQCERQRRGWSRRYVAERLGVSEYTIGQWERGKHTPYPDHIQKLCNLFDTDAEALGLTGIRLEANMDQISTTAASPREKQRLMLFFTVGMALVLVVALGVFVYVKPPLTPINVKPGGAWIDPVGSTVGDVVHFAAYAYPTNKGDPAIDYVNFTVYWQGVDPRTWKIACVVHTPIDNDVYACDADLRLLGAVPGQIIISFDVYDRQGNANLAPNGEHKLIYVPGR